MGAWFAATKRRARWSVKGLAAHQRLLRYLSFLLPILFLASLLSHLSQLTPPREIEYRPDDPLHELSRVQRNQIYSSIVSAHPGFLRTGRRNFADPWSERDDYQNLMGSHIRWLSDRLRIHYSTVYFAYDRAVREHWSTIPVHPVVHQLRTQ